jgi:uncharacterized membrane-anchored protein YhcB (DUF1043 family)
MNKDEEPAGNIPADKLEKILYDMQLADVYSQSVRKDTTENYGQKNKDSLARYYNEIFAHYNVTSEQFQKTMNWYKEHPPKLDSVYNNVLNRMSTDEENIRNMTPKPTNQDSAKNNQPNGGAPVL